MRLDSCSCSCTDVAQKVAGAAQAHEEARGVLPELAHLLERNAESRAASWLKSGMSVALSIVRTSVRCSDSHETLKPRPKAPEPCEVLELANRDACTGEDCLCATAFVFLHDKVNNI